jgi:hypothetical protein
LVVRADWIDLNMNRFAGRDDSAGDETVRITAGPSFRPAPTTAIRVMYQHDWITDVFNASRRAQGVQIGLATYF